MSDLSQSVYEHRPAEYDAMVSAEDCDRRILPAICAVCDLAGASVVEVGVGTGRVTRLLARAGVGRILGVDRAPTMLWVARAHMEALAPGGTGPPWGLAVADAELLPIADEEADLFVAAWVFGHSTIWTPSRWPGVVARCLREAKRVTRTGGTQIIFETLGTGVLDPAPPSTELGAYYRHLEVEEGFHRERFRTDYAFDSVAMAARACEVFFGRDLGDRIRRERWKRVPEWTGMWWKRLV